MQGRAEMEESMTEHRKWSGERERCDRIFGGKRRDRIRRKRKAEDRNRNRTDTGGKGMTARIFSRYLYRPGLPPIMLVQLVQSWGEQAVGMRNNALSI